MGDLVWVILFVAAVVGFIRGLTDKRPSFWTGFGEGLASKADRPGDIFLFFHDRQTGLGIGTRIRDDSQQVDTYTTD
jgi:hypothetical protein